MVDPVHEKLVIKSAVGINVRIRYRTMDCQGGRTRGGDRGARGGGGAVVATQLGRSADPASPLGSVFRDPPPLAHPGRPAAPFPIDTHAALCSPAPVRSFRLLSPYLRLPLPLPALPQIHPPSLRPPPPPPPHPRTSASPGTPGSWVKCTRTGSC
jgi:hypothetical protein